MIVHHTQRWTFVNDGAYWYSDRMNRAGEIFLSGSLAAAGLVVWMGPVQAAGLESRVNEAFRGAFGRNPSVTENRYWLGRVADKNTFEALRGAMFYHKARGVTVGTSSRVNGTKTVGSDNKETLIKDVLPLFVQIYGNDPANAEKAWWRKRINCNELTTHAALVNSMKFHKTKGARQGSSGICGGTASAGTAASGVGRRRVAGLSDHPMGDQVRIGIYHTDGSAITVTSDGSYQVREGGPKILATLSKDDEVKVSWSGGKYHVRGSGLSLDPAQEVRLVPLNQAVMQIKSYHDKSATIAGKDYNRFRGIIEIRKCNGCGELWAINELRVEYYLRGLAESSDTGPSEYLKALAVAARTYVLYHKAETGGRNPARGYDIGRTSDDQVYRGYEYEIITPRLSSVFASVKGIVATDGEGDKTVSIVYFSDSDGRTRSAKEKWGTDRFPHLQQSVPDPHHVSSTCRGHCVGMSAQGAYGFAKQDGWSWQKILAYYYKGIKLVKAY
jgi:hypothetical protein